MIWPELIVRRRAVYVQVLVFNGISRIQGYLNFILVNFLFLKLLYILFQEVQSLEVETEKCEPGCEKCGYNWYTKNHLTKHWNKHCGCCGGTAEQHRVCKRVCIGKSANERLVIHIIRT